MRRPEPRKPDPTGPRTRRPPAWLTAEVESGIAQLLAAGLPGAPGRKRAQDLTARWALFLTRRARPDHAGFPRIRAAFAHLASTAPRWPQPGDLLAAILPPPYTPPPPLPTRSRTPAGDVALATAREILGGPTRPGPE
jgi:hypothetical protein